MRHPLLLVFLGGCLGGALRWGMDVAFPATPMPWDLMAINLVGSGVLGVCAGYVHLAGERWWMPFMGPGLLGGFTTFSAMIAAHWVAGLSLAAGAAVLAGLMVAAVVLAAAGWLLGEARARHVGAA